MASVEKLSKKLSKILQKNIDEKKGCAIAITGEWGIGKTHFWNYFKDNFLKDKNEKIAYISLFGIESLDSLKYEIGIKTHSSDISDRDKKSNDKVKDFFTGLLSHIKVPDLESNGITLSIGQNLITNMIGGMVKDTIICIDDLERKSDKLDLKDVMGFVNQLKLEKNCQVIMILHEDKADKQYQEYKEKVFDDVFYLKENFEIIKEIINNNEVVHIYQDFYDKLQVKNIRFYERVNKDYNEILDLDNNLTMKNKDDILRNLLMVRYADFFPKEFKFKNRDNDFIFNLEFIVNFNLRNFVDSELEKIDKLNECFKGFIYFYGMLDWVKIVANNIINHNIDNDLFLKLVEQDKISEQKIQVKDQLDKLMMEWHNLDIKNNFSNRFYDVMIKFIDVNKSVDLDNVFFYYEVINSQNPDLANDFKKIVQDTIELMIKSYGRKPSLDNFYHSKIRDGDIFYEFLKGKIDNYYAIVNDGSINDDAFCDYFIAKFYDEPILRDVDLNLINKNILSKVIWSELKEERYFNRKRFIQLIISYCSNEKRVQVRQWIIELLNEKIQENPDSELAVKFWLTHTENLTKF